MVKKFKKMKITHIRKKSKNNENNKASKEHIEVFDNVNAKNKKENKINPKDYEELTEDIKKNEENNQEINIDLSKKINKKIRDTNLRNTFSFVLEEYTKSTLANKFFDIFSLKKIKIIYYSLKTLYNFYLDKNKAIASAILMCISLIDN